MQSKRLAPGAPPGPPRPCRRPSICDVAVADQLDDARALDRVVLDDQQRAATRRSTNALHARRRPRSSASLVDRLAAGRPMAPSCERRARGSSSVEMTCTGMWRVAGSCFRRSSTRQPSMSGRRMSSVMASGLNSRARASAAGAARRPRALEARLAGHVEQEAGEARRRSRRSAARGRRAGWSSRSSPDLDAAQRPDGSAAAAGAADAAPAADRGGVADGAAAAAAAARLRRARRSAAGRA